MQKDRHTDDERTGITKLIGGFGHLCEIPSKHSHGGLTITSGVEEMSHSLPKSMIKCSKFSSKFLFRFYRRLVYQSYKWLKLLIRKFRVRFSAPKPKVLQANPAK